MLDLTIYLAAIAGGVPILFVVWGLVQLLKLMKKPDGSQALSGNALLIASLGIGLTLGLLYWIYQTEPPAGTIHQLYAYWFAGIIYGLGLGILASLFWDALKAIVDAALKRLLDRATTPLPANFYKGREPSNIPPEGDR